MMRLAISLAVFLGAEAAMACPVEIKTQMDIDECAAADYQRADAALNAAWGPVKAHIDSYGDGAKLLDAQRKWIAFRDAACEAESSVWGISGWRMIMYSCLARLTRRRTEDLLLLLQE